MLHIEPKRENLSRKGGRQTLRAVWFRGHRRPWALHVATSPLHVLQLRQSDVEWRQHKINEIRLKYETKLAQQKHSQNLGFAFVDAFQKCCPSVSQKQHFESTHMRKKQIRRNMLEIVDIMSHAWSPCAQNHGIHNTRTTVQNQRNRVQTRIIKNHWKYDTCLAGRRENIWKT